MSRVRVHSISLSRFSGIWSVLFPPIPNFSSSFLHTTHTYIARVIVPSYQVHARVQTQRHCQHTHTYIHKQTSRTLSGIIPTYHSHTPVLSPSVPPSPGLILTYIPHFPLTYLREYLIRGVSCHHIHAQVRSITYIHTSTPAHKPSKVVNSGVTHHLQSHSSSFSYQNTIKFSGTQTIPTYYSTTTLPPKS